MNKVQRLFDSWAGTERGESMATGHDVLVSFILDRWDFAEVDNLLDAGCGNGRGLMHAYKRGAQKLAGIDLSKKMIAEAQKNMPEADLRNGSIDNMKVWDDDTFSHLMSIEALYYLPDPLKGLKEMRRVLRPGGKIAVAIDYYQENEGAHTWQDAIELKLALLSSDEWVEMFHKAGFDGVSASRIIRNEHVRTAKEFQPSAYFPDYGTYMQYVKGGALLLAN